MKSSLDVICTLDKQGVYVNVNEAFKRLLGYDNEEVIGKHYSQFLHPDDIAVTTSIAAEILEGSEVSDFENRGIRKDGQEVIFRWSAVWSREDSVMVCVGRDVTEQKMARKKEEFQKILVEHGANTLAVFDEKLNYVHSGGAIFKQMGYVPEQLVDTNLVNYIHPVDLPLVRASLSKAVETENDFVIPFLRFKDAKGEWRWIETVVSNQLHNPLVRALVTTSRDVTERVNQHIRLEESEQRFKSLFENHLDIILFQDQQGIIKDVNNTTLTFLGIAKEEIINRPFTDFLSPETIPICTRSLADALQGRRVRYDMSLPVEGKGIVTFDVSKIPVIVKGEVIGVYSILRDITEIFASHNTIKRQAEKLNTIMESITDAFFTLDTDGKFTYVNSEFDRLLHTDRSQLIGKSISEVFPREVDDEFYKQYQKAVKSGKAVHFEAYYHKLDVWVQVKAFPSEEGLSVYFDDVTEKVKFRKELEKLSFVASKTTNGVVITDHNGSIEWVNEGFSKLTGYALSEVVGKHPASFLIGKETDADTLKRYSEQRLKGIPFHLEMLNYTKSGEKVWVLLDISPVLDETGKVVRYITIQVDISERKEAEASQLKLTEDLYRQNQVLQEFTYIVSHNLRSPVANAMGLINVLSMVDKASEEFDVSMGYLKKSVYHLDTVLRDVNTILSIRDKKDGIDQEKVSLGQVCEQVMNSLQDSIDACGAEVSLRVSKGLYVNGDKTYLYTVFHNLLSNAIKYRLSQRSLKVEIEVMKNTETTCAVSFTDNGSGFDMNLAGDKVFKLYKRFHMGTVGRGMGLFLVKSYLNAIGASIEVSSEVNKGTRFIINFDKREEDFYNR